VAYRTGVHPIEHLRYVARARGADSSSLVRDAASALASLRADSANLVIACRRIVERHPEVGPLWSMCARLLTSDDPTSLAWQIADEIDADPAVRAVAAMFDNGPTLLTIGWPAVAGDAIVRRGDVEVLCADSRHEASGFLQRLERYDVACEPIPAESLARAAALADVVLVEASAAGSRRIIAPVGSHVIAAVARSVGTPVWLVAGAGARLPVEYVDAIGDRVIDAQKSWDLDVDDLPVELVTHVASASGLDDDVERALRPDCPFAPELLRTSPF
jgi:translation initiation factor 2B subunit (eIF-2B alpha/beta/delta family)